MAPQDRIALILAEAADTMPPSAISGESAAQRGAVIRAGSRDEAIACMLAFRREIPTDDVVLILAVAPDGLDLAAGMAWCASVLPHVTDCPS